MASKQGQGDRQVTASHASRARNRFSADLATTPATERFERYMRLLAEALDAEACVVALIGRDQRWQRHDWGTHHLASLDLDDLFDAVRSAGITEVSDLESWPRFADHAVVVNPPHCRFYAGIKLDGPRARPVGVLAVLGRQPRQLTAADKRRLTDFAALIEGELNLTNDLGEVRAELERTYLLDAVTQLPVPTLFYDQAEACIRDLGDQQRLVAVHLEVTQLDAINRAYGPAVGDELLRLLAHRAREAASDSPIVGRLPGARLVVVMRVDADNLSDPVERVVDAMDQSTNIAADTVAPGLLAGVALAPGDAEEGGHLIDCARQALRESDQDGHPPRIRFYDGRIGGPSGHQARIPFRLRDAVERRALGLAFQPIRELEDYRLVASEALVRWEDDALGKVVPDRFIPHVEEDPQLARALTHNVLEGACEHALAVGETGPDLSVNIPALEFFQPDFIPFVLGVIDGVGIPRERIILELTEHSFLSDPRRVASTLQELGRQGLRVALDDFGAGYSAISYLRHLPIDSIKLDRSLISELDIDLAAAEVASGLVSIGHSLGLLVVAEGIETPGELDLIRALGFDRAQGYLIGPPSTSADLAAWHVHSRQRPGS